MSSPFLDATLYGAALHALSLLFGLGQELKGQHADDKSALHVAQPCPRPPSTLTGPRLPRSSELNPPISASSFRSSRSFPEPRNFLPQQLELEVEQNPQRPSRTSAGPRKFTNRAAGRGVPSARRGPASEKCGDLIVGLTSFEVRGSRPFPARRCDQKGVGGIPKHDSNFNPLAVGWLASSSP